MSRCHGLNLNVCLQDMCWYSLAVVVDDYLPGQDHGGRGDQAAAWEVDQDD